MMEKSPVIFLLLNKHFEDKDARLPLWAFMHMFLYNNLYVLIRLKLILTQCYVTYIPFYTSPHCGINSTIKLV